MTKRKQHASREREREVEEDKCFGGVDGYLHNGAAFSKRAISGDYIASRWVPSPVGLLFLMMQLFISWLLKGGRK